jgi:hypothetical protein
MCLRYCTENPTRSFSSIQYIENCPNIVRLSEFRHILSDVLNVLYITNCPNIVAIDISHVNILIIYNCPKLETIPQSIYELNIDDRTKVTKMPIHTLQYFGCSDHNKYIESKFLSPRINIYNNQRILNQNYEKMKFLQRWIRKSIMYWRFRRWIRSREFNEWFYHPKGIGGRMHAKVILQIHSEISRDLYVLNNESTLRNRLL